MNIELSTIEGMVTPLTCAVLNLDQETDILETFQVDSEWKSPMKDSEWKSPMKDSEWKSLSRPMKEFPLSEWKSSSRPMKEFPFSEWKKAMSLALMEENYRALYIIKQRIGKTDIEKEMDAMVAHRWYATLHDFLNTSLDHSHMFERLLQLGCDSYDLYATVINISDISKDDIIRLLNKYSYVKLDFRDKLIKYHEIYQLA